MRDDFPVMVEHGKYSAKNVVISLNGASALEYGEVGLFIIRSILRC